MRDPNTQKDRKHETLKNPPCLVAIKNDIADSSLFPPHNHENLHNIQHSVTSPSSPLEFTSWDPPSPPSDVVRRDARVTWFGVSVGVLKAKFFGVVSELRRGNWGNGIVWACGLAFVWWVFAWRKRRRVVREKDEKIIQLLNQIAKMNELLLAHHKVSIPKIHE